MIEQDLEIIDFHHEPIITLDQLNHILALIGREMALEEPFDHEGNSLLREYQRRVLEAVDIQLEPQE